MENTRFEAAKRMWEKDSAAITALASELSAEEYELLYETIASCQGKVAVMGMGTSAIAARKVAHMICVADFPAFYLSPGDCAHGGLGAVNEKDIVIAISKSGMSTELVELMPSVKRKNIKVIAVTARPDSPLGRAADMVIRVDVPESDHKAMTANAGILAVIALFDAVADELTKREGYSEEVLYYNHIHGGVGEMLQKKLGIKDQAEDA